MSSRRVFNYPHMPIGKVWMSVTVCVCVCTVTVSAPRIKLAVSNFSQRFVGVHGRESNISVKFVPPEAQNRTRTNRPVRGPRPPGCKHYLRDAPT